MILFSAQDLSIENDLQFLNCRCYKLLTRYSAYKNIIVNSQMVLKQVKID